MHEQRVIKKYPNRRMYDSLESRYVTHEDLRQLVLQRVDFVVIEKKTLSDITRQVLLQVLAQQEQAAEPLMSVQFLTAALRSSDPCRTELAAQLRDRLEAAPVDIANARASGVRSAPSDEAMAGAQHRAEQAA